MPDALVFLLLALAALIVAGVEWTRRQYRFQLWLGSGFNLLGVSLTAIHAKGAAVLLAAASLVSAGTWVRAHRKDRAIPDGWKDR